MADPLPHLETFARAAEAGSFTAAARMLGLTQAAVSQRIAALERELGVALFRRHGGRVELTDAGRRLHDYAREIFALFERARAQITGQAVPVTGELLLAASSLPGEYLLPCVLARYQQRHPLVRVRVRVSDSQQVFADVEHGLAHVGLAGEAPASPHLEHRQFARDEMLLVVPARHPLAGRETISLDELRGLPLIVREPGSGSRHCSEQALGHAGLSLAGLTSLELGSNEGIKEAVVRGAGVAFLPALAVHDHVATGKVATLRVEGIDLGRDLYAVHDRRRALPIPARLFLDLLLAPA